MARKLEAQYYGRLFALLALTVVVILLSNMAELYRHQTEPQVLQSDSILSSIASLLPPIVLNLLPAFVALATILWLASRFIHTLYDTKDRREALDVLQRGILGMKGLQPMLIVKQGHIVVGEGSLYDRIGGRGFIVVDNDSAVVLERGGRLTRVVGGPYLGFLERFERIWEVVDLRRQFWPLTVEAITKDGIPIACEAKVTFKIDDRFVDRGGNVQTRMPVKTRRGPLTDADIEIALKKGGIPKPLPYLDEAVFKAATSIWMRIRQPDHAEQLRRWTGRVMIGATEGHLRSILADYRLDWLVQPPRPGQKNPREEICELLDERLREEFPVGNDVGARIIQVDLGQIDVAFDEISTQWIKAWQAGWEQRMMERRAEGEVEMARLQAVQVQAQAELALALTDAIRPLVSNPQEYSSYLLAMQFVETLRWMAYDPWKRVFLPPEALRMIDELEKIVERTDSSPEEPPVGT